MPRQIDLFPQNLQITSDPTNRLGVTAAQINHLQDQIPGALAAAEALALNALLTAIDKATGLNLVLWSQELQDLFSQTTADNLLASFQAWLAQTQQDAEAAWNNWVTILGDLGQTTATDFADFVAAIESDASNAAANWATVLEDLGIPAPTATSFVSWLLTLLTPNSALNASNLWGLIPTKVVGSVASTAVFDVSPNPLLNPNFESAISVSPGSGWVWDSTVYYTPPSGDTSPGSAKVVADGVLHALRSNLIPVSAGQSLSVSLPVLTSGVTGSGTPLAFHVVTYVGDNPSGVTPVAAIAVPTGATTGWVNPPTGSKGGTLTGTYVVASGVTQVQLRLVVDTTATAGTVRFGNATSTLSGGFLANLQTDTNDVIDSLSPGGTAAEFVNGIQNLLALFGLSKTSLGSATDLTAFWTAVVTDFINPLNALEISAINGLGSALSALLGTTTFQSLLDGIANVMGHSGTGHTITQIETYLGLIPPSNVTNVLGGSNLGADVSAVHTQTNAQLAWWQRLSEDLWILADLFHVYYPLGSPSDTATTTSGGKRTYYSAQADIKLLFNQSQSTTPPTLTLVDPGSQIQATAAAAMVAQGTATDASSDAGSALDQLTAVPQQNVVPLAVDTGQPAALVGSGAGGTNTGTGSVSVSWTDTIPSTANYVLVAANTATSNGGNASALVTVGGVSKSIPVVTKATYGVNSKLFLFALANPPVGAATFQVTVSDAGSTFSLVAATSMLFSNAISLSVPAAAQANNASPSLSTTFNSSQLVVNAIATIDTAGQPVGLSSYNRTQRYHAGNFNGGSLFNMDLLVGTTSGVTNPSFTASVANTTSEAFAALAVAVNQPPNILGSYARAYRSTTSGKSVSVANPIPGNYASLFDTSVASTDMTVDLSTGRITVDYSGTYLFKVGIAFTGLFATQTMEGLCFVTGQLFERSAQAWYASSSQTGFTWSTPVYLNTGDYVEPGCDFGSSTLITVVGDSAGSKTYMSLSLLNRSLL